MDVRKLRTPGLLLGIGLGGMVDGIMLHEILQVHAMLSNRFDPNESVANLKINMLWDGIFLAAVWTITVIGVVLLWKAIKHPEAFLSGRYLTGAMLMGWGLFNLVEGIIDHHLLQLHHVLQYGNHLLGDMAFLASGVLLTLVGGVVMKSASAVARTAENDHQIVRSGRGRALQ
jgi:uncharacterized membrane protein